jgi:hypothetical protein
METHQVKINYCLYCYADFDIMERHVEECTPEARAEAAERLRRFTEQRLEREYFWRFVDYDDWYGCLQCAALVTDRAKHARYCYNENDSSFMMRYLEMLDYAD